MAQDHATTGGKVSEGEYGCEEDGEEDSDGGEESDVVWSTPENFQRDQADHLNELRPGGVSSRFWTNGDDISMEPPVSMSPPDSPSIESMIRRAQAAGVSIQEMKEVNVLLEDSAISEKAAALNSPSSMDTHTRLARKTVKALIDGRRKAPVAGVWLDLYHHQERLHLLL